MFTLLGAHRCCSRSAYELLGAQKCCLSTAYELRCLVLKSAAQPLLLSHLALKGCVLKGCSNKLRSVALSSAILHSVLLCSVHGYARVRTSIYIYIHMWDGAHRYIERDKE